MPFSPNTMPTPMAWPKAPKAKTSVAVNPASRRAHIDIWISRCNFVSQWTALISCPTVTKTVIPISPLLNCTKNNQLMWRCRHSFNFVARFAPFTPIHTYLLGRWTSSQQPCSPTASSLRRRCGWQWEPDQIDRQ